MNTLPMQKPLSLRIPAGCLFVAYLGPRVSPRGDCHSSQHDKQAE